MKKLEGLEWTPAWTSHLGCVHGCLKFLKKDITPAWLWGGTGHAFIINQHENSCPSGPTAWKTIMLFELASNLGYRHDGFCDFKDQPTFDETKKKAWDHVRKSIDEGVPCYGWELGVPEFYVVNGYDDEGYYFQGCTAPGGGGPVPWEKLAETDIGVIEVYSVHPSEPADDKTVVKEAFSKALHYATKPEEWIFPKYHTGPDAFEVWAESMEDGSALGFGVSYCANVWHECRHLAVKFLAEAKERIGGDVSGLFDEGIGHYSIVRDKLKEVTELFPFSDPKEKENLDQMNDAMKDKEKCDSAAALLREAKVAEKAGLEILSRVVESL